MRKKICNAHFERFKKNFLHLYFKTGYTSCAQEAASFLLNIPGVDFSVGQGLLNYLSSQVNLSLSSTCSIPPSSLRLTGKIFNLSRALMNLFWCIHQVSLSQYALHGVFMATITLGNMVLGLMSVRL